MKHKNLELVKLIVVKLSASLSFYNGSWTTINLYDILRSSLRADILLSRSQAESICLFRLGNTLFYYVRRYFEGILRLKFPKFYEYATNIAEAETFLQYILAC